MTFDINIRPAAASDCPRMLELVRELAVYEKAPDEVTITLDHFRESAFGAHPLCWAIVAESGGQVVAFALWYVRFSTWKGQKMYLEDILVTEAWRGRGIGTMLMDELLRIAAQKGYMGISWQVLEWNEPAINFYKRYNARFDGEWLNATVDV